VVARILINQNPSVTAGTLLNSDILLTLCPSNAGGARYPIRCQLGRDFLSIEPVAFCIAIEIVARPNELILSGKIQPKSAEPKRISGERLRSTRPTVQTAESQVEHE
jgi:hypothetical protein